MGLFKRLKDSVGAKGEDDGASRHPYLARCNDLWKEYVPPAGQSTVLQGELLREVEALRWEAQSNGNVNWDEDFSRFCEFLESSLCGQNEMPDSMKAEVTAAIGRIKASGNYSQRYNAGLISEDDLDVGMLACVDDAPYDAVSNAIGFLDMRAGGPIPYEPDPSILR